MKVIIGTMRETILIVIRLKRLQTYILEDPLPCCNVRRLDKIRIGNEIEWYDTSDGSWNRCANV